MSCIYFIILASQLQQKFMRYRVLAQFGTIAVVGAGLMATTFADQKRESNSETERTAIFEQNQRNMQYAKDRKEKLLHAHDK
jgi:hypothetical protein